MKRFNYIFGMMLMSYIFMTSCSEKDRVFPEYATVEHGAFARLLGKIDGPYGQNFNYFDVNGSKISFEVEFYDDQNGKNVESYTIDVSHAQSNKKAQIAQTTSANFGTSANGLPNAKYSFTFAQVLSALGLTINDVNGGQRFVFGCTIKTKDGRTFSANNSSAALELPAFANLMRFNVNLVCPSELAGKYAYSTKGWCGTVQEGQLELKHEGNGVYNIFLDGNVEPDFSMGAYAACYGATATLPGGTLKMTDSCGKLAYSGTSRWGEDYSFNAVTVDGANLILDWFNSYPPEAAVTTITRNDGKPWPPLKK